MIERQIVAQKVRYFHIQEYIESLIGKLGYSHTDIQRTPLGEKVVIFTSRPGLVVGKKGENIKDLTEVLKKDYKMENPQIEVAEIENPFFDAQLVSRVIVSSLEKFGPKGFKSLGYKMLENILNAGALGAEIIIGGRGVPSSRAKSWRFSAGYLKKSGHVAITQVRKGYATANLKSGTIGIKVSILTPDIQLPDRIKIKESVVIPKEKELEIKEKIIEEKLQPALVLKDAEQKESKEEKPKKARKPRKAASKKAVKQHTHVEEKKDGHNKEERTKANE